MRGAQKLPDKEARKHGPGSRDRNISDERVIKYVRTSHDICLCHASSDISCFAYQVFRSWSTEINRKRRETVDIFDPRLL
jgi:hypothetical protein